jgi:uncharacterized membrane protein
MKLVRCKACGFIMPEGQHGDRCPACGAPRTAFEPYVDRRILRFHLHPIAVHFPTTLSVAVLVFSAGALFLTGRPGSLVESTVQILGTFLPLVVLLAGVIGFWDGKMRFRKISNSKILKTKLAYAIALLVVSLGIAVIVWPDGFVFRLLVLVLAAGTVVCSIFLGLLGMSLDDAAFPGK